MFMFMSPCQMIDSRHVFPLPSICFTLSCCVIFQDETVTIETVVPFEVSVKFISTKVCNGYSDMIDCVFKFTNTHEINHVFRKQSLIYI